MESKHSERDAVLNFPAVPAVPPGFPLFDLTIPA
jgi:hypothetical protein